MTLTPLDFKKLELEETLTILVNKGIVVVKGVESSTRGDILVRLDPRAVPVTQISLDTTRDINGKYSQPHWIVQDVPFNYFVTRDVYEFNKDYREYSPEFKVGDIVLYYHDDGVNAPIEDSAIVTRVYVDKVDNPKPKDELKYYYSLSNVPYNLAESKLKKI